MDSTDQKLRLGSSGATDEAICNKIEVRENEVVALIADSQVLILELWANLL